MKKLSLILGSSLLVTNLLFGIILTSYPALNIGINSAVIVVTFSLLYLINATKISDAFAFSLSFLFSFLGLIEFILGCFAPKQFENNWFLLTIVILFLIKGVFFTIVYLTSNNK